MMIFLEFFDEVTTDMVYYVVICQSVFNNICCFNGGNHIFEKNIFDKIFELSRPLDAQKGCGCVVEADHPENL